VDRIAAGGYRSGLARTIQGANVNLLFTCIGRRGYIADYFRAHLRSGEKIIGTSNTPWTPGFQSCDLGLVVPPIATDEYIPAIIDTCRKYEIGGLLSFFDPDVVALSTHLDELKAIGVIPLIPGEKAALIGYDKWNTFQTLRDAGFHGPDTTFDLEEARNGLRSGRFRFPLVVKPRTGFASANVFFAYDDTQLQAFFSYAADMLIQEFVDGDAYNIEALSDTEQRVLQVVAWRKLLSRLGETEQAVTVEDPELVVVGKKLAETVGLVGPMDVDLIRTNGRELRVLELNLRFGGGYPVSHLAGADFPRMIVEILRGGRPEPRIGQYKADVCLLKRLQVMGGTVEPFLLGLRSGGMAAEQTAPDPAQRAPAPVAKTHPYSTIEYGESLPHIGEAVYVPEWGTAVLRRDCGMGHHDAIGTYPITVFKPDCDLAGGLDRLARLGLVSVVLVIEDLLRPELAELQRTFDFTRPFKLHYLHDRAISPPRYSRNHRDKMRRAARAVSVERFDLADRLDEWDSLYQRLIVRHGLANTIHAFPSVHHAALPRLPGIVAIGAFAEGRLESCHLWACYQGHAMSHLVASSKEGYATRAAYAVNAASIELLSECRTLNFGGGAGASVESASGLVRFKRGFANATAPAYLCGKVLAASAYAELSHQAGVPADGAYFPAYRQPLSSQKYEPSASAEVE
jgi:carbamoyl-phosphate synthase large subunit